MSYFPDPGYRDKNDVELPCGCVNGMEGETPKRIACYRRTCRECTQLWRQYSVVRDNNDPSAWRWPQQAETRKQIFLADRAIDAHYAVGLRKLGLEMMVGGDCFPVGSEEARAYGRTPILSDPEGKTLKALLEHIG